MKGLFFFGDLGLEKRMEGGVGGVVVVLVAVLAVLGAGRRRGAEALTATWSARTEVFLLSFNSNK